REETYPPRPLSPSPTRKQPCNRTAGAAVDFSSKGEGRWGDAATAPGMTILAIHVAPGGQAAKCHTPLATWSRRRKRFPRRPLRLAQGGVVAKWPRVTGALGACHRVQLSLWKEFPGRCPGLSCPSPSGCDGTRLSHQRCGAGQPRATPWEFRATPWV